MPPPAGSAAPRLSHEASLLEAAPEPLSISAPLRDQAGESDGAGWTGLGERLIPLSGLALALFLVAHLALVALPLVDPDAFEALASALHRQLWLPVFEVLLAAALLLHPLLALQRSVRNRAARGPVAGPLRSRRGGGLEGAAALAGRWAPWSGAVLLVFLVVHLLQLRLERPAAGGELEAVLQAISGPFAVGLYALAGAAVGLHLLQANESAHRSLGWLEPANSDRIRWSGRGLALFLGIGFGLLPLLLLLLHPGASLR